MLCAPEHQMALITSDCVPQKRRSHPWCAGPNSAIIRLLLGVTPIEAGWTRLQIAPQPSTLKTITASVPFVLGPTATQLPLEITQTPSSLFVRFTVPKGTSAEVCLPPPHGAAAAATTANKAGGVTLDGKGVPTVARGRMLCIESDVVPGAHIAERA